MSEPGSSEDPKPNPLVRQSDLDVVVANNRTEHWKTRAILVGLTIAANSPALPALTGYLGLRMGWSW